ncbi:hypothetical protein V502_10882 [Pseudogymnoascus sp. VKM F-4520 (FW-2644)]|nr:hypothetical protein V502_10882 [Pseudogymnoascus sp. VKM F-4520 (FW-2644)]
MLDPFAPPPWLRTAFEPMSGLLHLNTLPLHAHEVLFGFAFYTCVNSVLGPFLSTRLFPATYRGLPRRTQQQWDMHVTSFVNSTFLSVALIYVILADQERANATWEDRIWGYTGADGLVHALSAGYFMWDLGACASHASTLGALDLLHAAVGFCISILGFRPFGPYYGIQYGLVELSTPFVNIHWFLGKMGLAGTRLQMVNGIVLMITFACCRLLWGSYMTFTFFGDVWTAIHAEKPSFTVYDYSRSEPPIALEHRAPGWVAISFMFTHTVVMSLSIFWFSKMVATVRKHVKSQADGKEKKVE